MDNEITDWMAELAREWLKEQPRKLPENVIDEGCRKLLAWPVQIKRINARGGKMAGWKVQILSKGLLYDFSIRYGVPVMTVEMKGRLTVEIAPQGSREG